MRRGLGTGQGKGYKNIVGKDPKVHADAAKGLKQPQRMPRSLESRYSQQEYDTQVAKQNKEEARLKPIIERNFKDKYITVVARRWFERVNGNTYHSAEVYVNGEFLGKVPFEYGYGDQYRQTAFKIMQKAGLVPKSELRSISGFPIDYLVYIDYERDNRNKFLYTVTDVERKKDL